MKEHLELIQASRVKATAILKSMDAKGPPDMAYVKDKLRDEMGEFLFVKTELRPMVIPVIIEV
jgi:mRNA degradation ribonuclease J1/J2